MFVNSCSVSVLSSSYSDISRVSDAEAFLGEGVHCLHAVREECPFSIEKRLLSRGHNTLLVLDRVLSYRALCLLRMHDEVFLVEVVAAYAFRGEEIPLVLLEYVLLCEVSSLHSPCFSGEIFFGYLHRRTHLFLSLSNLRLNSLHSPLAEELVSKLAQDDSFLSLHLDHRLA